MTTLWRAHLFAGHGSEGRDYCINNNIVGLGWERYISDKDDIEYYKSKVMDHWKKIPSSINSITKIKNGDLVWVRDGSGQYRLGKIFNVDDKAHIPTNSLDEKHNLFGIYRSVEKWYTCNDWQVPGKVMSCLIKGCSLQRICEESLIPYCESLYLNLSKGVPLKLESTDYSLIKGLIHYDDLEDLLGVWLQVTKNYVVFPSTNKQGTKDYEYMLKRKNSDIKAVIQCKTGDSDIDVSKLEEYVNKGYNVYLVTTYGKILNKPDNIIEVNTKFMEAKKPKMYNVSLDYLLDWAKENKYILPDRIKYYFEIMGY